VHNTHLSLLISVGDEEEDDEGIRICWIERDLPPPSLTEKN